MKIGLLISGNLGKIVFDHLANRHSIVFVMTNSKSVEIIEECKEKKSKLLRVIPEIIELQIL